MELPTIGRNAVLKIEYAETIRTADRHSFRGERHQPLRPGLAVAALPEAGRENNSRADAALERLLEDVAGGLGRDREHDQSTDFGRSRTDAKLGQPSTSE